MAKTNVRITRNRDALERATLAVGDGILAICEEIVAAADPPDAPPFGQGLVDTGAAGVWVNGKKIGGNADKPRTLKVRQYNVVGIAGFGFPARFQEIGTANQGALPFLTPAANLVSPKGPGIVAQIVSRVTGRP